MDAGTTWKAEWHMVYIFGHFRPAQNVWHKHMHDVTNSGLSLSLLRVLYSSTNTTTSHAVARCDVEQCCVWWQGNWPRKKKHARSCGIPTTSYHTVITVETALQTYALLMHAPKMCNFDSKPALADSESQLAKAKAELSRVTAIGHSHSDSCITILLARKRTIGSSWQHWSLKVSRGFLYSNRQHS